MQVTRYCLKPILRGDKPDTRIHGAWHAALGDS